MEETSIFQVQVILTSFLTRSSLFSQHRRYVIHRTLTKISYSIVFILWSISREDCDRLIHKKLEEATKDKYIFFLNTCNEIFKLYLNSKNQKKISPYLLIWFDQDNTHPLRYYRWTVYNSLVSCGTGRMLDSTSWRNRCAIPVTANDQPWVLSNNDFLPFLSHAQFITWANIKPQFYTALTVLFNFNSSK